MLCGAAVFSAIELPTEREAKERWEERLENFTRRHNLSRAELRHFLREYEEASVAGIRVDDIRPRWDFTGAFYFVGTVVSTIGERRDGRAPGGGGARAGGPAMRCSVPPRRVAGSQRARVGARACSCVFAAPFFAFFLPKSRCRGRVSLGKRSAQGAPQRQRAARPALGAELRAARAADTRMLFAGAVCLRGSTCSRDTVVDFVRDQSQPKPKALNNSV